MHAPDDPLVPIEQSETYCAAADLATLVRVGQGHFEHLDPASPSCAAMREGLARFDGGRGRVTVGSRISVSIVVVTTRGA